jgi:hypothetical protein
LSILTAALFQQLARMSVEPTVTSCVINRFVISVYVCIIRTVSVRPSVPVVVFRIVGVDEWGIHVRRQWRGRDVICLPLEVIGQPAMLCR